MICHVQLKYGADVFVFLNERAQFVRVEPEQLHRFRYLHDRRCRRAGSSPITAPVVFMAIALPSTMTCASPEVR